MFQPLVQIFFGVSFAISIFYGTSLAQAGEIGIGDVGDIQKLSDHHLAIPIAPDHQRLPAGTALFRRLMGILDVPPWWSTATGT